MFKRVHTSLDLSIPQQRYLAAVGEQVLVVFSNGVSCIALYERDSPNGDRPQRLFGLSSKGEVNWMISTTWLESFSQIEVLGRSLVGFTWDGYEVVIEPETGHIMRRTFLK